MAEPAKKRATYADLEAVPPHLVAEIIDGVLRTHPRPSPRHSGAANAISAKLTDPFQWGGGGPGGWVFFVEPELKLVGGRWAKVGAWNSDDQVRAPPFDAISFSLADLWPLDKPLGFNEDPQALYAGDR